MDLFLRWIAVVINRAMGYAGVLSTAVWLIAVVVPDWATKTAPTLAPVVAHWAPVSGVLLLGFASFQAWREAQRGAEEREDDGYVTLAENPIITDEMADGRFRVIFVFYNPGSSSVEDAKVSLIPIMDNVLGIQWDLTIGFIGANQQHKFEHIFRLPDDIDSLRTFDVKNRTFRCEVYFTYRKTHTGHSYKKLEKLESSQLVRKVLQVTSRGTPKRIQ